MYLYPQLPHPAAQALCAELRFLSLTDAETASATKHPAATFTPTGGNTVGERHLADLRSEVVGIAQSHGYPDPPAEAQRSAFDTSTAISLHQGLRVVPAEASKHGMWEFLSCVLLCDIARWRFGAGLDPTPNERLLAGRRNTFQRLWWRAHLLSDMTMEDEYWLLRKLGEDEVVQLMERPNLAGCRVLTRSVATVFLEAAAQYPELSRRLLIREAQKYLMRLASIVSFDAFEEEQARALVRRVFARVASAARLKGDSHI